MVLYHSNSNPNGHSAKLGGIHWIKEPDKTGGQEAKKVTGDISYPWLYSGHSTGATGRAVWF